jgi:hypothetical protein
VLRTRGHAHGAITRLVSPGDIGQLTKPFVFLDYFEGEPADAPPSDSIRIRELPRSR